LQPGQDVPLEPGRLLSSQPGRGGITMFQPFWIRRAGPRVRKQRRLRDVRSYPQQPRRSRGLHGAAAGNHSSKLPVTSAQSGTLLSRGGGIIPQRIPPTVSKNASGNSTRLCAWRCGACVGSASAEAMNADRRPRKDRSPAERVQQAASRRGPSRRERARDRARARAPEPLRGASATRG
jgi:hypothetical protein